MRLSLVGVTVGVLEAGRREVELSTSAGPVMASFYPGAIADPGLLLLEAGQQKAARELAPLPGASVLVPSYRDAADPVARVLDALVAAHAMRALGLERWGVVGLGEGAREALEVARLAGPAGLGLVEAPSWVASELAALHLPLALWDGDLPDLGEAIAGWAAALPEAED